MYTEAILMAEINGTRLYDTIVVGAGIEGSSAAYQLAKNGKITLLLEQVRCSPPSFFIHCTMHM